ncbi:MAG: hypothetical protein GF401_01435 [Chitinivibrionales bacterium]|nr:hypothetical protein [Chitinivibrionales bacterium]
MSISQKSKNTVVKGEWSNKGRLCLPANHFCAGRATVVVLFGCEESGLLTKEIELCDCISPVSVFICPLAMLQDLKKIK